MGLDDETIAKLLAGSIDPLAKDFEIAALYFPALKAQNPPQPDRKIIYTDGKTELTVFVVNPPCAPE